MNKPEQQAHNHAVDVAECTKVRSGVPLPFGAHESEGGVNFALCSRHARHVRLELFDHPEDTLPARVIDLDSARNRTGDVWHVWVQGISQRNTPVSTGERSAAAHDVRRALMKRAIPMTTLFLDVGGVLLTDGWDRHARKRAAASFKLELAEMEERHHRTFEVYETGKLTLDEYLSLVVFYRKRPFTPAQFRRFMFAQSKPYPEMIERIARLKVWYGLKIIVVSNEGREVNAHRIRTFKLDRFVDCFVSSCFVHIRKPDAAIFRLALDIAQVPVRQVLYIENTPMFVEVAEGLGIQSILHTDYRSTCARLASLGLQSDEGEI